MFINILMLYRLYCFRTHCLSLEEEKEEPLAGVTNKTEQVEDE